MQGKLTKWSVSLQVLESQDAATAHFKYVSSENTPTESDGFWIRGILLKTRLGIPPGTLHTSFLIFSTTQEES